MSSRSRPLTRTDDVRRPELQQRILAFNDSFWASNLSALVMAAMAGGAVTLATQQLFLGFAGAFAAGWYLRRSYHRLVRWAQASVDTWQWDAGRSLVVTFEDALVAHGAGKLRVWLRVTNASPVAWSVRGGRVEIVRVGDSKVANAPLLLTGVVPGDVFLESPGAHVIFEFSGPIPPHTASGTWLPVFIGTSQHPDNPDRGIAGYLDVQGGRANEPALVLPQMVGTARSTDGTM